MIYTCYEMMRDCRQNRPEGWRFFVARYVPVLRRLLAHYGGEEERLEPLLIALHDPAASLFATQEPAPERWFVAELRQKVVAELTPSTPEGELALPDVAAAFEPLTMLEKQVAWIETMRYGPADTGAMLRMSAATVEKIRLRAAELLRGRLDSWRSSLLADHGLALGREATAAQGKDCLPSRIFLDALDGRTTWRGREEIERHVSGCWHCIDHYCRMAEVIGLLRASEILPDAEAERFYQLVGVEPRRSGWKAIFGRA